MDWTWKRSLRSRHWRRSSRCCRHSTDEPRRRRSRPIDLPGCLDCPLTSGFRRNSPKSTQPIFLAQGGRKLGTKPPSTTERLQVPPSRHIALPRPDLSAREALQLIKPFMARFGAPWHLASLGSYGRIQVDGRGDWRPSYRYAASGDVIHVPLIAKDRNGRLSFQAEVMPAHAISGAHEAIPLPEEWLDSTDVAAIVARQAPPEGLGKPYLGLMSLAPQKDLPLLWTVFQSAVDRSSKFASWILAIDATTGQLMFETLGRLSGSMIIPARQRVHGAPWMDVPPPA